MAGLNHDFMLLASEEHPIENWESCYHNPDAVKIHDDVLEYLADTLKWIPTYNPATKRPFQGLCWHGPTVIRESGALVTAKVFSLCRLAKLRTGGRGIDWCVRMEGGE